MSNFRALKDLLSRAMDELSSVATSAVDIEMTAPRWVVLARPEDERSDFREDDRITHGDLDAMVEVFDPSRRRVPVICAQSTESFGGHAAGWLPPTGRVMELDRDLLNLWGSVASFVDPVTRLPRIDHLVTIGYRGGSIGFQPRSNETDGKPMLLHYAQLSEGEQPGIQAMPYLDQLGFGLTEEQIAELPKVTGRSLEDRFGFSVRDLEREWKAFGRMDGQQRAEVRYQITRQIATRASEAGIAEGVMSMSDSEIRTAVAEGLQGFGDRIDKMTKGIDALVQLQTSLHQAEQERAAAAEAQRVKDEAAAEAQRARDTAEELRVAAEGARARQEQATTYCRQLVQLGIADASQAEKLIPQFSASDDQLQVLRRLVEDQAAPRFAEVRTSSAPLTASYSVPVEVTRHFHSTSQEMASNPSPDDMRQFNEIAAIAQRMAEGTGESYYSHLKAAAQYHAKGVR